jgi:hypothetical protein
VRTLRVVLTALLGAALVLPAPAVAAKSSTAATQASTTVSTTTSATATPTVVSPSSLPSQSAGGSNPLSPGFPQPSVSTPTTTTAVPTISTATSAGSGSGLTGNSAIIIAVGAIIVLGGISLYIWRDARRRAPARSRAGGAIDEGRRSGSKQRAKPRKLSPAERKRRKRGRAR